MIVVTGLNVYFQYAGINSDGSESIMLLRIADSALADFISFSVAV